MSESEKALRKMLHWLCVGLPDIDDFDIEAKKLSDDDNRLYDLALQYHMDKYGDGIGPIDIEALIKQGRDS